MMHWTMQIDDFAHEIEIPLHNYVLKLFYENIPRMQGLPGFRMSYF